LNITDPILAQCRYQPDSPALCVPGDHHTVITYSRLGKMIHNCWKMVCTRCGMIGADVRPDWSPHVNKRHV